MFRDLIHDDVNTIFLVSVNRSIWDYFCLQRRDTVSFDISNLFLWC